jgi:hypothetical protein
MLSAEDGAILKEKIAQQRERQEHLKVQIKRAERDCEQTAALKSMLPMAMQSKEQEERELTEESSSIKRKMEAIESEYNQKCKSQDNQLLELENGLGNRIEKMERFRDLLERLEHQLVRVKSQEEPILTCYKKAKSDSRRLEELRAKIPRIAPLVLTIEDCENCFSFLKYSCSTTHSRLETVKHRILKLTEENTLRSSEFFRMSSECEDLLEEVKRHEDGRRTIYSDLVAMTSECDRLNELRKVLNRNCSTEIATNSLELDKAMQLILEEKQRLLEVDSFIENFPHYVQKSLFEQEVLLGKRKQLAAEIRRKIDFCIQEETRKQNESPQVIKLTKELEGHWHEHEKMLQRSCELEKRLKCRQDDLERKKLGLSEISEVMGKVRELNGMDALERAYEMSVEENRVLGKRMMSLRRELYIYESEKRQFLRELSELEKKCV